MQLSVVIPVYNEVQHVAEIIKRVRATGLASEIVVVDDCSQDGTQIVLQERISRLVDQIIYHPVNRGKGAA